jgi:hypothetical protein
MHNEWPLWRPPRPARTAAGALGRRAGRRGGHRPAGGIAYTVVGIYRSAQRVVTGESAMLIPDNTALADYGNPQPGIGNQDEAQMVIATRVGAAQQAARHIAAAELPTDPSRLVVTSPPSPTTLQSQVSGDLAGLFLILALISLLIGAVGIANTTLVAVLERTEEIGLRRAVSARPRHIAAQFLAESTTLGTLGGLTCTCIGVAVVVIFAAAKNWTAILNPIYTLPAPLIGAIVGLLDGAYPALPLPIPARWRRCTTRERNDHAHPYRPVPAGLLLRGPGRLPAAPDKGPDTTVTTPAVGRPPSPASAQAAVSAEAFTPYAALELSSNDGLAPGESQYTLAGACMSAAGYPGANARGIVAVHFGSELYALSFPLPWGGWGYLGAADAQQYGFSDQFLPYMPAIPAADQAAAGKCATIVQDFGNATDVGALSGIYNLGNDISVDVAQDPAVKTAARAWSACMAKNGYSFDQPQAVWGQERQAMYGPPPNNMPAPVSASANGAQLAAAVTDAGCTRSSDLAGIYFAVQASYEHQLITANQQALGAEVRQYKAAYSRELSKLPALLRTAKAQPFPTG